MMKLRLTGQKLTLLPPSASQHSLGRRSKSRTRSIPHQSALGFHGEDPILSKAPFSIPLITKAELAVSWAYSGLTVH
jgi:hypothetical protein